MKLEWDPKIGPATITAFGGTLAVLVTLGIVWGTTTTKLDTVIQDNKETKAVVAAQDRRVANQATKISAMESTLTFIIPTIQRIEAAISPTPAPPHFPPFATPGAGPPGHP
jgi:hypothetical protein